MHMQGRAQQQKVMAQICQSNGTAAFQLSNSTEMSPLKLTELYLVKLVQSKKIVRATQTDLYSFLDLDHAYLLLRNLEQEV